MNDTLRSSVLGAFHQVRISPVIQRGVLATLIGACLLLWPNASLNLAVALGGVGLIVAAVLEGVQRLRRRASEDGPGKSRLSIDILIGAALVTVSAFSAQLLTGAVALALSVRGIISGIQSVRAKRSGLPSFWLGVLCLMQLVFALSVALVGTQLIIVVLLIVGFSWAGTGIMVILQGLKSGEAKEMPALTIESLKAWFRYRDVGDDLRVDIVERLIFDGPRQTERILRFTSLMSFATAIATLGVLTDSTAVVIGAMLVAPLMTPIMATSVSLVMGNPRKALSALTLVASGVGIAVGFSFLIARYVPGVVEIISNSQIESRTAPTLLDLLVAVAAGCAGGYAVCRPDVSDSLPGVAIAVALVPPLAVVGVTLADGSGGLAWGAFLLFLTNLVGIIFASGLMFAFTGVVTWNQLSENPDRIRRTMVTVVAALAIVSIPLAITGQSIYTNAGNQESTSSAVHHWLGDDSDFDLLKVSVDGHDVEVSLVGDGKISKSKATKLANLLASALGRQVDLSLRLVPETRLNAKSDAAN